MIKSLILYASTILIGWECPTSTTFKKYEDIDGYKYISLVDLDLNKVKSDFVTVIYQDSVYFKYSFNQKSRFFYVSYFPNDTIANTVVVLNNSLSIYRFSDWIKVSPSPKINYSEVKLVYFIDSALRVKYVRYLAKGEILYTSSIVKRNDSEYEILVGIEYPRIDSVFADNKDNFLPISIHLAPISQDYVPYFWLFDRGETPNVLLWEYHENKIERLLDAMGPD
jgi:hypothetical protein